MISVWSLAGGKGSSFIAQALSLKQKTCLLYGNSLNLKLVVCIAQAFSLRAVGGRFFCKALNDGEWIREHE
jgi:hypothetical protein